MDFESVDELSQIVKYFDGGFPFTVVPSVHRMSPMLTDWANAMVYIREAIKKQRRFFMVLGF